jgi:hypothetical protein
MRKCSSVLRNREHIIQFCVCVRVYRCVCVCGGKEREPSHILFMMTLDLTYELFFRTSMDLCMAENQVQLAANIIHQHSIRQSDQTPEQKCVCGLAVNCRSDPTPLSWVLVVLKKLVSLST